VRTPTEIRRNAILRVRAPPHVNPIEDYIHRIISISSISSAMAQPIPQALAHLVTLNSEYNVLICIDGKCKYALEPTAISRHLRDKHKTAMELREQVEQYIEGFPFAYNHASVPLPTDGSAPQPIIPIVDGFICRDCPVKSVSKKAMRNHGNRAHNKKKVPNEDIFQAAQLQSWFGEKRERYWVVDKGQQVEAARQAHRATIQDAGEECDDAEERNADNPSDGEHSQDEADDQIVQEIENWKAEAQEWRLQALKDVPAVELDSWLQYTKWNEVLGASKHDLVKTSQFARQPDPNEPKLERVLRAWSRILSRCLDTLAATDQKDTLKWWESPKMEAASQRPFGLPQSTKGIDKYSRVWESLICYMMRMAPVEHWEDETGEH
jgi:Orsellinic acid/F9775 biosynthesis cluster protein D